MGLRVVAGSCRGRRLVTPEGNDVRPTSDRVREAVFNSLGSMGALGGASVLDLFAGSGAMGIEALSRGAEHVTFVDGSPHAIRAITANLDTCDLADRATVVRSESVRFLKSGSNGGESRRYDLAVLDPPYEFDDWAALLGLVDASVVLIESNRRVDLPAAGLNGEFTLSRERRYGGTFVTIAISERRETHDRTSEGHT
ncbi:MAG: 16S rRNA (guanine(966)-N(2))-methyltransferase RsmD [Microthrixaceae bacterium]